MTPQQVAWWLVVFAVATLSSGLLVRYAWNEWTLFAGLGLAMYLGGSLAIMPWKTPLRKAFSIGVSLGCALATIEWFYRLRGGR
jgi:hypothetical protein